MKLERGSRLVLGVTVEKLMFTSQTLETYWIFSQWTFCRFLHFCSMTTLVRTCMRRYRPRHVPRTQTHIHTSAYTLILQATSSNAECTHLLSFCLTHALSCFFIHFLCLSANRPASPCMDAIRYYQLIHWCSLLACLAHLAPVAQLAPGFTAWFLTERSQLFGSHGEQHW